MKKHKITKPVQNQNPIQDQARSLTEPASVPNQKQMEMEQEPAQGQNSSRREALKVHILVFSYAFDIDYLEYCLKSIDKFATGFTGATVIVPEKELAMFKTRFPEADIRGTWYPENEILGHLHHQGMKCAPDKYVPTGTDLVCFLDSDCVFTQPVSPDDYIVDGKPELLIKRFDSLKPGTNPWQTPTEEILKTNVYYETMQRHPHLGWTAMYPELRAHVEKLQGMEFQSFILTRKPTFVWGCSEFNLMGNFVLLNEKWKEKYHFVDLTGDKPHPKSSEKLVQFWSRSPIDKPQSTPWQLNLVPIEFCRSLGL